MKNGKWYIRAEQPEKEDISVGPFCCRQQAKELRDIMLREEFTKAVVKKAEPGMVYDMTAYIYFSPTVRAPEEDAD